MAKSNHNFSLTPDEYDKLTVLAQDVERSRSDFVGRLIRAQWEKLYGTMSPDGMLVDPGVTYETQETEQESADA